MAHCHYMHPVANRCSNFKYLRSNDSANIQALMFSVAPNEITYTAVTGILFRHIAVLLVTIWRHR